MVEYKYAELFTQDSIDKQLVIQTDDKLVTITNTELHSEQFELTESLCSKSELRFGCCEASSIKFRISNVFIPLKDKWLTVSETLAGNTDEPFMIGRYKVFSDKPTADRRCRDIVAYDAMYDIINADVSDWYNAVLPDKTSTVTLKQFRTNFISHFGLEQEEIDLINDDMIVEKNIEPSEISGKDVITAICEINGCFGHVGRNGKFRYIVLPKYIEGLYPANDLYPADDLYPRAPRTTKIGNNIYISCKYEDYITHKIDKLQIRQEENDIGSIAGTGSNCYIVEDNFLVYGKSSADLERVANNLFSVISEIMYRPFDADVKGNPCFEVGDAVRLTTRYEIIESYILKRTLKGVQALRDRYSADGIEEYVEKVNSVNRSIIQLKGKTNTLERTVEETKLEIKDVEKNLTSTITQTAGEIRADVENNYTTKTETSKVETKLNSSITQMASSIKSEVSATYETKDDAQSEYSAMSSKIEQNAEQINLRVEKDNVIAEINLSSETAKIAAEKLELAGKVEMTGGYMHIDAGDSGGNPNLIHFTRGETEVGMGNDGVYANGGGRSAIFQYSQIGVLQGSLIAFLKDDGKGISSYGWESYSDERLKHDIEPLDIYERAKFIYAQEPCRFKYNYDSDGHYRHGLIAQKAQETIGAEDWALCGNSAVADGETYLTLNYLELIADLIATVQSLNERVTELEGKQNEQSI